MSSELRPELSDELRPELSDELSDELRSELSPELSSELNSDPAPFQSSVLSSQFRVPWHRSRGLAAQEKSPTYPLLDVLMANEL